MEFERFIRVGGRGEVTLGATRHGRVALSFKGGAPGRDALRAAFGAALDEAAAENARMLLGAVGDAGDPPLTEADLPDVSPVRADALAEWDRRMAVLWLEWHSHPQRLRPLREAMERDLLRAHAGAVNEVRQRALGVTHYVWRSRDDARVRSAHAAQDDQTFAWDDPPEGGHPGQAHNCRCWAEPMAPGASPRLSEGAPEPLRIIETFLAENGPVLSAGDGVRPREGLLDWFQPADRAVTVNGGMLDVQTQGDLAVAFHGLGRRRQG